MNKHDKSLRNTRKQSHIEDCKEEIAKCDMLIKEHEGKAVGLSPFEDRRSWSEYQRELRNLQNRRAFARMKMNNIEEGRPALGYATQSKFLPSTN